MKKRPVVKSTSKLHHSRLTYYGNFYFSGVFQLYFNFKSYIPSHLFGLKIINVCRSNKNPNLSTCLQSISFFNAFKRCSYALQVFQTFKVIFNTIPPRARSTSRYGVGNLNNNRFNGFVRILLVMSLHRFNYFFRRTKLLEYSSAYFHMCTLHLVVNRFAYVVQKSPRLGNVDIRPKLLSQHASDMSHFHGVLKYVLSVTRPEVQPSQNMNNARVQVDDSAFVSGFCSFVFYGFIDVLLRFLNQFLNLRRLYSAVSYKIFQSHSGNLSSYVIKRRDGYRPRGIINNYFYACNSFKSFYISTFLAYYFALKLVRRYYHRR